MKTIRLLANLTNTAGGDSVVESAGYGETYSGYSFVDLVCSVNTITGSTGNMRIHCYELFGPQYVLTASSGTLTSVTATQFAVTNNPTTGAFAITYNAPGNAGNALLGKGGQKKITTSLNSGTFAVFNVDVYAVYYVG